MGNKAFEVLKSQKVLTDLVTKKSNDWSGGLEISKAYKRKLNMGKSCVRFKKMDEIPYKLIGELMKKISVKEWINIYEKNIKK